MWPRMGKYASTPSRKIGRRILVLVTFSWYFALSHSLYNQLINHSHFLYLSTQTIKCLLIAPNPESALNEEAGKLLLEAYEDYARHAKLWTGIHAKKELSSLKAATSSKTASSTSSASISRTTKATTTTQASAQAKKAPSSSSATARKTDGQGSSEKKKSLRRL